MNPLGFKIGLELMGKCPINNVQEIPYEFQNRVFLFLIVVVFDIHLNNKKYKKLVTRRK